MSMEQVEWQLTPPIPANYNDWESDAIQPLGEHNFVALLILPVLCVTGLIGNIMVCIAIWSDRRLHNVTNYFLFSLALADLLVCMVVMPLAILVEVKQGVWIWSFWLCLMYTYADVFLCSASIVHISVISLDRYLGISRPLKLRNKSGTIVVLKICFVWIMTIIISCPLAALAVLEPTTILLDNACTIRSRHYMIYGSTLSFLIPFIIMTITFTKTTKLLNKQANTLSQKQAEGQNGGLRRTVMQHKKLGYTRTNSYNTLPSRTGSIKRQGKSNGVTLQMSPLVKYQDHATIIDARDLTVHRPLFNNISTDTEEDSVFDRKSFVDEKSTNDFTDLHRTVSQEFQLLKARLQRSSTRLKSQLDRVKSRLASMAHRRHEKMENTNSELANEHKATRVLAVVFACFFTCWTPFFIMNFTLGFCGDQCAMPSWLISIILWLGYLSSTLNPVIYTIFNRRFREAFLRIIRCKCLKPRDSSTYTRSHVFLTGDATWTCMDKSALMRDSNSTIVNGSPKSVWINYSANKRRRLSDKHRVRAVVSNSSSSSSKLLPCIDKPDTPSILLSKPTSVKIERRNGRSLEELPQSRSGYLGEDIADLHKAPLYFPPNRRFSAAATLFTNFEPLKKNAVRSTPVLTISTCEDTNEEVEQKIVENFRSFTTSESLPNIDDDVEEEEEEFKESATSTVRSQLSLDPLPYQQPEFEMFRF